MCHGISLLKSIWQNEIVGILFFFSLSTEMKIAATAVEVYRSKKQWRPLHIQQ